MCCHHRQEVAWFAEAVPAEGFIDGKVVSLGCPVFKRAWQDDPTGNLWPVDRLAPCKLAAVPHKSHKENLVVLDRFASFLDEVPACVRVLSDFQDVDAYI